MGVIAIRTTHNPASEQPALRLSWAYGPKSFDNLVWWQETIRLRRFFERMAPTQLVCGIFGPDYGSTEYGRAGQEQLSLVMVDR